LRVRPFLVRRADDSDLVDGRMLVQYLLDLGRVDVFAPEMIILSDRVDEQL